VIFSEKARREGRRLYVHFAVWFFICLFGLPFVWMVATSLKTDAQMADFSSLSKLLVPWPIQWGNYPETLTYINLIRATYNTLIVTSLSVVGTLISCSLVAFSFSRLRWPGRDVAFVVLLSTMMLPPQVTMIPLFLIYAKLGWINTLRPLWLPSFLGNAFYIFLLRQFFFTIPQDLEDSAKIDGCSYFGIYRRIMLPLVKPALASIVIFQILFSWNDFLGPLIYVHSRSLMTLAQAVQAFQTSQHEFDWQFLMAAATMMTLPILTIFFAAQRYFISGVTLTGMKG
jgi:ABC-type glycerol-3-phosphate transport system permease component